MKGVHMYIRNVSIEDIYYMNNSGMIYDIYDLLSASSYTHLSESDSAEIVVTCMLLQ